MTTDQILQYISVRNGVLSSDEVLYLLDISRHPQINSFEYKDGTYHMWDYDGTCFKFRRRWAYD